jgi:alpha-D-ribose 1-methylphosphonate 5-triphosphate synthase subunit PhnL
MRIVPRVIANDNDAAPSELQRLQDLEEALERAALLAELSRPERAWHENELQGAKQSAGHPAWED